MPSLIEAIEKKYFANTEYEIDNGSNTDDFRIASTVQADKLLFSIFVPRLSPLMLVPELLVLNDCDIDCAGNFETIKEKCRRVRELDLAQNKLKDWEEVFHIIEHMPRIEFLNLSKNQLGSLRSLEPPGSLLQNLKGIVLNGTNLEWQCVDVLLKNLPSLEELHLSLNNYKEVLIDRANEANITEIDDDTTTNNGGEAETQTEEAKRAEVSDEDARCFNDTENASGSNKRNHIPAHQTLRTLHFTGNPIEHWYEICRLGRVFPSLQNLFLAECPIRTLCLPNTDKTSTIPEEHEEEVSSSSSCSGGSSAAEEEPAHKHFPNLVFLNLSSANIKTWDDIDKLADFPKLKSLRVKNWPLWDSLECTEFERRQLLIARLPNITCLNGGGVISADEREDAERAFIRHYMEKPEWERPKRYDFLVAKHGKLDPLVNINLKPDKSIKILLTYKDVSEEKVVDVYRTVADLKQRLEKIVGLPANKMRLYYCDQDFKELGPEEMRYPNKLLYSYNIQSGDEIIIDEKK